MSTTEELEKIVKDLQARMKTLEDVIKEHVVQPLQEHTETIAEHAKKIAHLEQKQDTK